MIVIDMHLYKALARAMKLTANADEINAAAAGGAVTTEGAMDAIKAVR